MRMSKRERERANDDRGIVYDWYRGWWYYYSNAEKTCCEVYPFLLYVQDFSRWRCNASLREKVRWQLSHAGLPSLDTSLIVSGEHADSCGGDDGGGDDADDADDGGDSAGDDGAVSGGRWDKQSHCVSFVYSR